MDLCQQKLTKDEWDYLEIPLSHDELEILKFIRDNKKFTESYNNNLSLLSYLKIQNNDEFHKYFYNKYYKPIIEKYNKKYDLNFSIIIEDKMIKIKKADRIRIKKNDNKDILKNSNIYENVIIKLIKNYLSTKKPKYYYSLYKLIRYNIKSFNIYLKEITLKMLEYFKNDLNKMKLIKKSSEYIEKNELLSKYQDIKLYDHQRELFNVMNSNHNSTLLLYQAPTGTGKTISPVGLVNDNVVIFTCAAKHVGLQLAKACISLEIPIATAFGCDTAEQIRLHYFAATDFTRHRKSGNIFKVDNSQGQKVKLIITDIKSYLPAMNYMLAFNDEKDIIWYWDEPTITLDYDKHDFHSILERNWKQNCISRVVMSSATLPNEKELLSMIQYYKHKFKGNHYYINSYDCKKTISLISSKGNVIIPHLQYENYDDFKQSILFLKDNKTILRYVDITKVSEFIIYVNKNVKLLEHLKIDNYFDDLNEITINNIKQYYLQICKVITEKDFMIFKSELNNKKMFESSIKITTEDANTLTDGPTIFISNNVDKTALFYLRASNIPDKELDDLLNIIDTNMEYKEELNKLMKAEKERLAKINDKILDSARESDVELKLQKIYNKKLEAVLSKLRKAELNSEYIPNKDNHFKKWHPTSNKPDNLFTSDIDEEYVEKIMALDVNKEWKILLLMGIGVFTTFSDIKYLDIMKKLAEEQKLYLIIASSDYIYGTNYQFCHGYLAKDLINMTQEKMIQALGRVGRRNIKKTYTVRLRDDNLINKLFLEEENKKEVINMNRLFGLN